LLAEPQSLTIDLGKGDRMAGSIIPPTTHFSIPSAEQISTRWVPVVDRDTGTVCLMLEPAYRFHQSRGSSISMHFNLPELAAAVASAGPEPVPPFEPQYTEPQTVAKWAAVFELSRNTASTYLRNGNIRAKRVGSLWAVDVRDLPKDARR
jgi:hypothetical protein